MWVFNNGWISESLCIGSMYSIWRLFAYRLAMNTIASSLLATFKIQRQQTMTAIRTPRTISRPAPQACPRLSAQMP